MGVYEEVLHKIQTDYVTDPNIQNVTTGALHGMLESLDPDSSYLTPADYANYLQHEHEGVAQVGMDVSKRYGYGSVISVIPGSPADKAHIEDGDLIESIGGHSTREMSVAMIRLLLEGKPGTSVTFELVRHLKPEPDEVALTRAAVTPPALFQQQYENSSILYLKPIVLTKSASTRSSRASMKCRRTATAKCCSTCGMWLRATPSRGSAWPMPSCSPEPSRPSRGKRFPPRPSAQNPRSS